MKDYYDIYCFLTKLKSDINIKILKQAINSTFRKRESFGYLDDYEEIIDSILESEKMKNLWLKYSKKNIYANDIEFSEILNLLKDFLKGLNIDFVYA